MQTIILMQSFIYLSHARIVIKSKLNTEYIHYYTSENILNPLMNWHTDKNKRFWVRISENSILAKYHKIRERKNVFEKFFELCHHWMYLLQAPRNPLNQTIFLKFVREHAFFTRLRFLSPWDNIWTKILIWWKKTCSRSNFEKRFGAMASSEPGEGTSSA